MLGLQHGIEIDTLFKILDRLPGLEELRIEDLMRDPYSDPSTIVEARVKRSPRPLSVRTLVVEKRYVPVEDKLLALVVGQLLRLVCIQAPKIRNKTIEALWSHCYHLDTVRGKTGEKTIQDW
ncbi:hypothetical protein BGX33_001431 [Mortierella sp. NVP41]|nr:hypothetical protein BGX33_001431 [Mortierella sp. NVP41]